MKKDAVINLRISNELKQKLKDTCYDRRMKMTEAIEQALEQWIEKEDTTQSTQSTQVNLDNLESTNLGSYHDRALEEKIEQLENTIKQQQDDLASSKASREDILERLNLLETDQRDHGQRLDKQDQRYQDNARDIGKLQDCYPEIKKDYKVQKEDIRTLKQDVQTLKINRVTPQQHQNLQDYTSYLKPLLEGLSCPVDVPFEVQTYQRDHAERLDDAVTPSMLDERLAMATEPIWETLTLETEKRDQDESLERDQDLEVPVPTELNQAKLAKRLGVRDGTIINHRDKQDFPEWSKERDPDGYAWKYDSENKKFNPVI